MAVYLEYSLATVGTELQVTLNWFTVASGGTAIQTDIQRYTLTDPSISALTGAQFAARVKQAALDRATQIDRGVVLYQAVQTALGAGVGVRVQVT